MSMRQSALCAALCLTTLCAWSAEPAGQTLDALVTAALSKDPRLMAADYAITASRHRHDAAGSWPNPMLQVQAIGDMAQTAAGEATAMVMVTQPIPWPGKTSAQRDLVHAGIGSASANRDALRLAIARDVRVAYFDWQRSEQSIAIISQHRELVSDLREAVVARMATGKATQADLLRIELQLGELANQADMWQAQRGAALATLTRLADDTVTPAAFAGPVVPPALTSAPAENHPLLTMQSAQLERAAASHQMARLSRRPDFSLSASYTMIDDEGLSPVANGDDQWWIGVGISVPVWQGSLGSAEEAALADITRARADLRNAHAQLHENTARLGAMLESARARTTRLAEELQPQAQARVDSLLAAYRSDTGDFNVLIDAWRQLLGIELAVHHASADAWSTWAQLRHALGITDAPSGDTP